MRLLLTLLALLVTFSYPVLADEVGSRASPIIYSRTPLTITITEKPEPVKEDQDFPWVSDKAAKSEPEKKQMRLMVDLKDADAFIKTEEAYIDMGMYSAKSGVLVVFPKFGRHSLSLANLNSSADFIFMDSYGTITEIYPKIIPGALEEFKNTTPSYAMLILQSGLIDKNKIKVGDSVLHKVLETPSRASETTEPPVKKQVIGSSPVIFRNSPVKK